MILRHLSDYEVLRLVLSRSTSATEDTITSDPFHDISSLKLSLFGLLTARVGAMLLPALERAAWASRMSKFCLTRVVDVFFNDYNSLNKPQVPFLNILILDPYALCLRRFVQRSAGRLSPRYTTVGTLPPSDHFADLVSVIKVICV